MSRENIHATGLVLDDKGVLLRGPSGAGKSLLALLLLDDFAGRGRGAKLVSDDRVELETDEDGLVMHAPASIAGQIELRGRGIVERPHVASARLRLVVDLVDALDRMPEEDALRTVLLGTEIARCPVPVADKIDRMHQLLLIREALRAIPSPLAGVGKRRKKIA